MAASISVHVGSVTPVWPNAATTGVPRGTVLTTHVGDMNINTPGQVVQNLHMIGQFIVNAPGVTIQNCLIDGWSTFAISTNGAAQTGTPLLIQDCEIGPPQFDPADQNHAFGATQILEINFIARRLNMYGSENGFSVDGNALIEDCYIHDLNLKGTDPHSDCIQFADSVSNVIIRHNRLESMGADNSGHIVNGTSCIISPQASSGPHDVVIDNNLFAGGGYALYGPQNGKATNVQITNNKFWTTYFPLCGAFGPWTDASDEDLVTGNTFYPSGLPLGG